VNWNAVSAIAGVLGAISVTLTVVYLVIQIKKSTEATQAQTYHLATSALAEMAAIVGTDKQLSRIFRIGMANPDDLDEDERVQFSYLGISLFRRFENVFIQYQSGMVDDDFWIGHRDNILWFFHQPGMKTWWEEGRKFAFSKRFRDFLDASTQDQVASPKSRNV
jgi:hypothetical protein